MLKAGWVRALVLGLLLPALVAACGGGGLLPSGPPTGSPSIGRPSAVATATPWAVPPTPIFVDGTPRPAAGGTPAPQAGQTTYTVQAGDSPASIAARFGVDVQELMRANNITDPTRLAVGQVLVIPGTRAPASPTPRPASPGPTPTPTPRAGQPGACGDTYIVQAGDFPGLIAQKCGVDVAELMRLNGITDPTSLKVGQELKIPRR